MPGRPRLVDRLRVPLGLVGLLVPLGLWYLGSIFGAIPEAVLPGPGAVIAKAIALPADPDFQQGAMATLFRWMTGFALGGAAGFVLGILVGSTRWTRHALLPSIDFFRSIPVTIAFPAFLLAFGLSDRANIAMAFAATVFLVALNVAMGIGTGAPQRAAFLTLMRAKWSDRVRYLYLPEALDGFLLALRATLSLSLIVTLLSEMFVGSRYGLGQLAYNAYLANSPQTVFAIILWVGAAGMAANRGFGFFSAPPRQS
jgi:sulfonate transport system permease protein